MNNWKVNSINSSCYSFFFPAIPDLFVKTFSRDVIL